MAIFTYLFGAGASFNVLPLVKNFPDRLKEFGLYVESNFPKSVQENPLITNKIDNPLGQFTIDLQTLIFETKNHASIDTYAKKLYLIGDGKELLKLKSLIDLFLSIEQFRKGVDQRYDAFFAALLQEENYFIKLPENIRIVTWNYDFQIELTLGSLLQTVDTNQLESRISIFPPFIRSTHNSFSIVKLNGTAMGWLFENDKFNKNSFDPKMVKAKFSNAYKDKMLKNLFHSYFVNNYLSNPDQVHTPSILYSWEKDSISGNARLYAKQIMERTDYLIVIGYSFPTFNRSVDKELLTAMKNPEHIYIQSPASTIKSVVQRFKALYNEGYIQPSFEYRLTEIKEVDEFFIPFEFE